jgi:sugar phosphate isomerase/epimerase
MREGSCMRFGGPVSNYKDPEQWISKLKSWGYSAAYCPVGSEASEGTIKDYREAAAKANIKIAEVGAWSNPLSPDDKTRKTAITLCQKQLELAEKIGAGCCVNISGSRGEVWDGPHADNYSKETLALVVDSVREIIDTVKPKNTFYTLEPMPWMYPYDAESYLELLRAVDRKQFAVHFDPVNVVSSVSLYYNNGAMIKEWFKKLSPYIKSCHAKDIKLGNKLTVHLDEVIIGYGELDYVTLLNELNKLHVDTPLMLEHLQTEQEYEAAAANVRKVADSCGIKFI